MFADSILNVAIGLIFLFALLSLVTTSVTEGFANLLSTRSRALSHWLERMLSERSETGQHEHSLGKQLLEHPLIRSLQPGSKLAPDYIPPRAFTVVLLELIGDVDADGCRKRPQDCAQLEQLIAKIDPKSPLRQVLSNLVTSARGDMDRAERAIQTWFDASMNRLSSWYARRAQLAAFFFAVTLTVLLNADATMIAGALWQDSATQAVLLERAAQTAAAKAENMPSSEGLEVYADTLRALDGFPLGWSLENYDRRCVPSDVGGWAAKLLGFAITVLATTLGAPFWFGLLSRVINLRTRAQSALDEARAQATASEDKLRDEADDLSH